MTHYDREAITAGILAIILFGIIIASVAGVI